MNENIDKTIKNTKTIPTSNHDTGIEFAKLNGYTIYEFKNGNYNYFLSIPDEYTDTYQMFIGFPKKDLKETSKSEIINEIDEIKKMIAGVNKNGIYLLPDIPLNMLEEAARENDNKKFNHLLNDVVRPMIQNTYTKMKDYGSKDRSIEQVINWIKQTEFDTKFIQWIEFNMPNFAYGITYEELKKYYYGNDDIKSNEVFENPTKTLDEEPLEMKNNREKAKTRTLKLDNDYYKMAGFSNIFKTLIVLSVIVIASIMIGIFILK